MRFNLKTTFFFRLFEGAALSAALLGVLTPGALGAEPATPQANAVNAGFLAYAPPPSGGAKVCVVDTGVDLTTDAAPAVVERYAMDGGTPDDVGGGGLAKHGTYVAGVIASQREGRDSVGIWPQARIASVRVFDAETGATSVGAYLQALNRCRDTGAEVVNLSLSGLDTASSEQLAQLGNKIADLRNNWAINVVAAAGNSGSDAVGYPARFPDILAVGASDAAGAFCSFSSRGSAVDVSAFGCGVRLSWPGGGTATGSGTSLAAPIVSAALAALRAYEPELTAQDAEALLLDTAHTAAAGKVLDVAAAFRNAGLSGLVDAPPPAEAQPAAPAPSPAPAAAPAAPVAAASIVLRKVVMPSAADPLAELGVRRPKVRSSSYRRGVLRVAVAGVPDFGRAVFTVDKRRYVRPSGELTVRLRRAPKHVSVLIDVPEVGHTAAVKVKLKAAGPRR